MPLIQGNNLIVLDLRSYQMKRVSRANFVINHLTIDRTMNTFYLHFNLLLLAE